MRDETRRAREQASIILAVSACAIAGLSALALRWWVAAGVVALAGGALTRAIDESSPGGFEAHLTREPVASPADWRLAQLTDAAGWPTRPIIWTRRGLLAAALIPWAISFL